MEIKMNKWFSSEESDVRKDIILVVSGQFRNKVVLQSLGAEPQVQDDHTEETGRGNDITKV